MSKSLKSRRESGVLCGSRKPRKRGSVRKRLSSLSTRKRRAKREVIQLGMLGVQDQEITASGPGGLSVRLRVLDTDEGGNMKSALINGECCVVRVSTASEVLGVSRQRIHQLIEAGRLGAVRLRNMVLVRWDDVCARKARSRRPGRPSKS